MRLKTLRLQNFRSYQSAALTAPEGVTVIVGENGTGKTNLLEAIHLCCLGRSHRTSEDRDLIRQGSETAAAELIVERRDGTHDVGVRLYREARRKKLIYVNGKTASRMGDLIGHATCVIFSPEDLSVVKDGPAVRRRYLDMLLSQLQRAYFYALQTYTSTLRQRNALLKALAAGGSKNQLDVWDEQLARAAAPLVRLRAETARALDGLAFRHYAFISGRDDEAFRLTYETTLSWEEPEADMLRQLRARRDDELRRAVTLVGPHRDDLCLTLSGQDFQATGSQGQARTAALALKLSAFDLLSESQGEPPLLLLDDVLSELDSLRRQRLIARVRDCQALLTCTDRTDFIGAEPARVLEVRNGQILESGS